MTRYKSLFEDYLFKYCNGSQGALSAQKKFCLLGDGHRIRPQLVLAWCEYCGGDVQKALPAALAIEFIHTMSLIHDDLPCMDNEEIRRGNPTLHRVYGEDIALLTGDQLLAESFTVLCDADLAADQKIKAITILSSAAQEMANGQAIELTSQLNSAEVFKDVHYGKTASLLAASCSLGAVIAGCEEAKLHEAFLFGRELGMGYQYLDDLNDRDGSFVIYGAEQTYKKAVEHLKKCVVLQERPAGKFLNTIARNLL